MQVEQLIVALLTPFVIGLAVYLVYKIGLLMVAFAVLGVALYSRSE